MRRWQKISIAAGVCVFCVLMPAGARDQGKTKSKEKTVVGDLLLAGGRRLVYERSFSSQQEVTIKKHFWTRVLDFVAGPPEMHGLARPYGIVEDSRGRFIVTDPGARAVHIFDFAQQKYKFIAREGKDGFKAPQCVAVDAQDNFYVSDSEAGKIFVFDANGKFTRVIGSLKYGEGFFKRPTGIAVDSAANRIYVSDTLRNEIYVMDLAGSVLQTIGKAGTGNGEFYFPTELKLTAQELYVVDGMNFRIQVLDRSGSFLYAIGQPGTETGTTFRPKGVGVDSEDSVYVVDALWGMVQVFNRRGELLYYFGKNGTAAGEFELPSGLFIDRNDHILVVDSYNRRIQEYRYFGAGKQKAGGAP